MTPTTTTTSIRDWLIDCAVRWQRRNKLLVPRAGATPGVDEVAAVIGPRASELRGLTAEPSIEALEAALEAPAFDGHEATTGPSEAAAPAELLVEQTLVVPAVADPTTASVVESPEADAVAINDDAELEAIADDMGAAALEAIAAPVADDVAPIETEAPAAEAAPESDAVASDVVETPSDAPVADDVAIAPAPETIEAPVADETPVAEAAPAPVAADETTEPSAPTRRAADKREPVAPPLEMATVVPPTAVTAPFVPTIDFEKMSSWEVMVLAGPAGSGKSSIAQQFSELLPKAVHIKIEQLRDRTYSMLVARPAARDGVVSQPEVWSGTTEEARAQAVQLSEAYVHTGHHVIIDDVIESATELTPYLDGLAPLATRIVTLMPSVEEMERRDRMRADGKSTGARVREQHTTMARQMGQHSTVLDTSHETVFETVQRIIGLLES